MKHILLVLAALILIGAGAFYYNNLRGASPAVLPAIGNIVERVTDKDVEPGVNQTEFPLVLPDGLSVSIFAQGLGNPRMLAWDPEGTLLVSIPSQGKVVALTNPQTTVVGGLNSPHGIAFLGDTLYVAETNQVATYSYDSKTKQATNKRKIVDLPGGGNHFSRTIGFGPDGKLYIAIGSTCNVCIEDDPRRTKILVSNADGSDLQEYASGLRNSVFFRWHPKTNELWATEMGRDLIGDNIPPDEVNIIKQGSFYGWPFCYGKNVEDKTFTPNNGCSEATSSHIDLQAHSAPLGLAFIPGSWPSQYHDDLLISYHGSWNRTQPTGYKIVRAKLDENGNYEATEDFISGWLSPGGALGRPVDLLFGPDSSLYVSDDKAGVVYRVTQM